MGRYINVRSIASGTSPPVVVEADDSYSQVFPLVLLPTGFTPLFVIKQKLDFDDFDQNV